MPDSKMFAIKAEGFEFPDFVEAESLEAAIIKWVYEVVDIEVTEIEQD